MQVELISSGTGNGTTGLSRYAETVFREVENAGVNARLARPKIPLGPVLASLGRRLKLDPMTFFSNYPVAVEPQGADLYHLASENLASLLIFRRLRPVVVTVHAFFTYFLRDDPRLSMHGNLFHRAFDHLAARGLHRADAIIAVSNYVAQLLVEDLDLPAERVHVIPEAVDHDFFRPLPVPPSFREKHRLDPDLFYVLYVGSEQPRKNFPVLLKTFARVRAKNDRIRLLKVGAPELHSERERALSLIRSLDIEQDVTFVGHVDDELPLFYNAADLFLFPSLYEGFGFPPLEAMACGTPVICSNATSLPEVVGDAALLFDPADEDHLAELLWRALRDRDLRETYCQKGLERAATFSWEETARQTIKLYERLVKTR